MKFFIAFALIAAVATASPIKPRLVSEDYSQIAEIVAAIQSPSTDPATAAVLETMLLDVLGASPVAVGPAIVGVSPISVGPAFVETSPISVGPALVETSPISVGPAFVDFPMPDGGVVTADEPVAIVAPSPVVQPIQPSPVVIGEIPAGSTPLVQIIVNVNQEDASYVVVPTPVQTPVIEEVYVPGPVNVVDNVIPEAVVSPVQVAEPIVPGPVNVVDNVIPEAVVSPVQVAEPIVPGPVNVVDNVFPEVVVSPVQVAEPIVPGPVNVVDNVVVSPVISPVLVGTPIIPAPVVTLPEELN